ncbi:hypothetical protein IFM89_038948 [Coptis chinensis]|uniref:KIB1-4 beta-propeller domain-containing protein n=1 Tax=Coptis chinensis TaxID=261450 RepID=A0A835IZP5_9MAGN|nr:hypothetical protein IFM89_038948 [Coptis chinensis]
MLVSCATKEKSLLYSRIGDDQWVEKKFEYKKRICNRTVNLHYGRFDIISCQGKIYLFFSGGMAVIDVDDTFSMKIHIWCDTQKFSKFGCYRYTNYYVESCGEIFLVSALHLAHSSNIIKRFDVFKVDLSKKVLVNVDSLGDSIFLISHSSTASFSGSEFGMDGNCIYFSFPEQTSLYKYDIDNGTITNTLPCPSKVDHMAGPFWLVPDYNLREGVKRLTNVRLIEVIWSFFQVKKQLVKVEEAIDEVNNNNKKCKAPHEFIASHCNPVFYAGSFYTLSIDGRLGLFNPSEPEYKDVWKVLPMPVVVRF